MHIVIKRSSLPKIVNGIGSMEIEGAEIIKEKSSERYSLLYLLGTEAEHSVKISKH